MVEKILFDELRTELRSVWELFNISSTLISLAEARNFDMVNLNKDDCAALYRANLVDVILRLSEKYSLQAVRETLKQNEFKFYFGNHLSKDYFSK